MSIRQGSKVIAGNPKYYLDLFDVKWTDHKLNNPSWLRADTFSWQNAEMYEVAYQHLADDIESSERTIYYAWSYNNGEYYYYTLSETPSAYDTLYEYSNETMVEADPLLELREYDSSTTPPSIRLYHDGAGSTFYCYRDVTKDVSIAIPKTLQSETIAGITVQFYLADDGHKICPKGEESNVQAIYNATGVAWYYILDSISKRFKLPRTKFGFTGIRSDVGKFVEAGLPNITGNTHWIGAVFNNNNTSYANGVFSAFDTNNGAYAGGGGYGNAAGRLNFNASRSSSIYGNSDTVQPKATEMYLYFYVGNFTQTALENTAGVVTEDFNELNAHKVIAFQVPTSTNNYTWYRKYADGWVEQGGLCSGTAENNPVTMPVEMSNTEYQVLAIADPTDSVNSWGWIVITRNSKTTTGFSLGGRYSGGNVLPVRTHWQVSGMAAIS